jgi:hypothetical protein
MRVHTSPTMSYYNVRLQSGSLLAMHTRIYSDYTEVTDIDANSLTLDRKAAVHQFHCTYTTLTPLFCEEGLSICNKEVLAS